MPTINGLRAEGRGQNEVTFERIISDIINSEKIKNTQHILWDKKLLFFSKKLTLIVLPQVFIQTYESQTLYDHMKSVTSPLKIRYSEY